MVVVFENEQKFFQVVDEDLVILDVINFEIFGFELQLSGVLLEDWYVLVNYSNLDGEIVECFGLIGRMLCELLENMFLVWLIY